MHSPPFFLILVVQFRALGNAQCYYPGGDLAANQIPCDKFAFTSQCCPSGWTCFSNHLCVVTDTSAIAQPLAVGTSIRGTCTDPRWNNSSCGDFCLNDPVQSNNGSLIPCGNNRWCCQPSLEAGICDCKTESGTFVVPEGKAQTIIGVEGLTSTSTDVFSASTSASAITSARTQPSSTTSSFSSISLTSTSILRSSAASRSASPVIGPTSMADTSNAITKMKSFKIGITVGVILLVAIMSGLLAFALIRRRRHKQRRQQNHQLPHPNGDPNRQVLNRSNTVFSAPTPNPYAGNDEIDNNRWNPVTRVPVGRSRQGIPSPPRPEENPYRRDAQSPVYEGA